MFGMINKIVFLISSKNEGVYIMKRKLIIILLLNFHFAFSELSFGQREINFKLEITHCVINGDTIKIKLKRGKLNNGRYKRLIIWENDTTKLAVSLYAKIRWHRVNKEKVRVEV